MTTVRADVALLTERRYTAPTAAADDWYFGNILADDRHLQDALRASGLSSVRIDWSRPDVDWSQFRCAAFRSTWDYFDRFAEFSTWLDRIERQTRLCNDAVTVRWNADKHYLADLATRGVPVVPLRFLERGSADELPDILAATGWDDAIVKPCVSGAARHTYRVSRANAGDIDAIVRPLLTTESFIVQPFQTDVLTRGEVSLVAIDGRFSHAVRKVPARGDFRVQDDYGGTLHAHEPPAEEVELAERAVAACRPLPAYARVDAVRDNDGRFAVMELELIEPELWLRRHPPAASALADAIARTV